MLSPGTSAAVITHVLSLGATHVLSAGAATVSVPVLQVLSRAVSPVVPARPLSAPKAKAAEKAAASAERSILLCIVGFVLI
ncbi:hypothetical protein FBY34_2318 [Streptomyces sp. SLBN-115]|nr:hypothetical protein FBY34_2318 [Streptomyces sp. SLBN-115]